MRGVNSLFPLLIGMGIQGQWLCRVLLLDHEKHTEKTVVAAITTVIPGTSPEHALNCYITAKKLGQAIITSCIKGAPACALPMPCAWQDVLNVNCSVSCCATSVVTSPCTLKGALVLHGRSRFCGAC